MSRIYIIMLDADTPFFSRTNNRTRKMICTRGLKKRESIAEEVEQEGTYVAQG